MSGADRPLSAALELSVYRVVQEALTNVVKHAPGARGDGQPDRLQQRHQPGRHRRRRPRRAPGRRRAASRAGPRDRGDARADSGVRWLAPRRADGGPRLPGDQPRSRSRVRCDDQGPGRGRPGAAPHRVLVADRRRGRPGGHGPGSRRTAGGRARSGPGAEHPAVMDVRMPVLDGIQATRQIFPNEGRGACPPGTHPHHLRPGRVRLRGAAGRGERVRAEEPPARGTARRRSAPSPPARRSWPRA